ncbi:hypothetical protein Y032_0146g2541 [Ancylostoma ceylanicum]|uniref:Uncharacterized protein n=1 Tax=Ancylostoma ceylanicum TaxID=53326 RepID=A0A016T2Q0_9BILA|nr:hypothetical protein Y032_0146g2541 [Ancylostoma ceylanicum]
MIRSDGYHLNSLLCCNIDKISANITKQLQSSSFHHHLDSHPRRTPALTIRLETLLLQVFVQFIHAWVLCQVGDNLHVEGSTCIPLLPLSLKIRISSRLQRSSQDL